MEPVISWVGFIKKIKIVIHSNVIYIYIYIYIYVCVCVSLPLVSMGFALANSTNYIFRKLNFQVEFAMCVEHLQMK